MSNLARILIVFGVLVGLCATAKAQTVGASARRLLEPLGLDQFPKLYVRALDVFLTAEDLYDKGDYRGAQDLLEALWTEDPPGGEPWARCPSAIFGIHIGRPPCYCALRMLTDCVCWRRREKEQTARPTRSPTATLTVLLVGHSKGIEPTSMSDLERGAGRQAEHTLDPLLLKDDYRVIHQSLSLFREYISAMTAGRLGLQTRVLRLPDLCVPVHAAAKTHRVAGLAAGAMDKVWAAVPPEVSASTDWWWVLYPSHVPEQYPDFTRTEFITGGMGSGPDGSPCFIIDDRWLVRKPPHLGQGPYTDEERRAYLPQWLQHEFYHHLFRIYPEFKLEEKSHQWFARKTWPPDFQGRFEADYYYEALHKRLLTAEPPLYVKLLYAPPSKELYRGLSVASLCGAYRHEPVQNNWHEGAIQPDAQPGPDGNPALRWTNKAGVSWRLFPELKDGLLRTGPDNPYYQKNPANGRAFRIILSRGADGEYLPEVSGFQFQGGFYAREAGQR